MMIERVNRKVMPLAKIMGSSPIKIPYTNHKKRLTEKTKKVANERSFVCLVLNTFITCGKNDIVVNVAATNPMIKAIFI